MTKSTFVTIVALAVAAPLLAVSVYCGYEMVMFASYDPSCFWLGGRACTDPIVREQMSMSILGTVLAGGVSFMLLYTAFATVYEKLRER